MARIFERGTGQPIVLVPGIQGRWEWMAPTIDALAAYGRAITFSLCDEPTSGFTWDQERGFENYLAQLDEVLVATGAVATGAGRRLVRRSRCRRVRRPASGAGGRAGDRLGAAADLDARSTRQPLPVVAAAGGARLLPRRADAHLPRDQGGDSGGHAPLAVRAAPAGAGRRRHAVVGPHGPAAALAAGGAVRPRPAAATCRPSIVTGEPELERVVPPAQTAEYLAWLPRARATTLPRTGHAGTVTKAREFAALVGEFAAGLADDAPASRTA